MEFLKTLLPIYVNVFKKEEKKSRFGKRSDEEIGLLRVDMKLGQFRSLTPRILEVQLLRLVYQIQI